jgi:hypothetical protein
MNLLEFFFNQSFLKPVLAPWQSCQYLGERNDGILAYQLSRPGLQQVLLTATIIRREESLVWKSCNEMLDRTLKNAAESLQGFFGFELLALELGDRIRSFQWGNFRQYVVNQARAMSVGDLKLVQYTGMFGLFKKRVAETYGKMDYQHHVKVFLKEPAELDLMVKKLLKEAGVSPAICVIQDLSTDALFKFGDEHQTPRLQKLLQKSKAAGNLPEIYILDRRGSCELGDQFGLRGHV